MVFLRLNVLLLCLLFGVSVGAQHHSLSSLYMYNKYDRISAYAGLEGSVHVTGNYRSQWRGLTSSPVSQRLNAHLPLYFLNGAAGVKIENHKQGPQGIFDFEASYNYVRPFSWGILSAGLSVGAFQYRVDGETLRTPGGTYTDLIINHNDSRLSEQINSSIGATYGLSVYLVTQYFETGFDLKQLPSYAIGLREGEFSYSTLLNWYGEGNFTIFNQYDLKPSFLIQSDLVNTQVDVSVVVNNSGNIFGGIGMRGYSGSTLDSVIPILGWRFNDNYVVSYAFDIGVSALRTVHEGTHEIQLVYNLNKKIGAGLPPKVIYNPRYM